MIRLNIAVPESRDRAALATLSRGMKRLAQGYAAASTSTQIATARGNPQCDPLRAWGHPPAGTYRLINSRPSTADCSAEYGAHLLLFEPQSGAALSAQAAGRVGLLVYGGPAGADKRMRRTQGGVRLDNKMLDAIVKQAAHQDEITLTVETLRKPAWWQFWKSMPDTPLLSSSAAKAYAAPLDEMSLILELMKTAVRRPPSLVSDDRDDRRWNDRSGSISNSEPEPFRGGGGQSGGAGSSGGWDSAPSTAGTARGVDASGRIMAGAAIGVAAAVAATAAAGAVVHDGDTAAGVASGDSGDAGSVGDSGNATTSSTAY